jgi:hypothetical protein
MTSDNEKPPWIDIAEQASKETDPRKLTALVEQLCDALDRRVQSNHGRKHPVDPSV